MSPSLLPLCRAVLAAREAGEGMPEDAVNRTLVQRDIEDFIHELAAEVVAIVAERDEMESGRDRWFAAWKDAGERIKAGDEAWHGADRLRNAAESQLVTCRSALAEACDIGIDALMDIDPNAPETHAAVLKLAEIKKSSQP